ncbi:MAG: hypothetical protein KDI56_14270, partial [Xanthomonadales bacterium]|nr:hypothetical protein [Xanthomonadales bacterium]
SSISGSSTEALSSCASCMSEWINPATFSQAAGIRSGGKLAGHLGNVDDTGVRIRTAGDAALT